MGNETNERGEYGQIIVNLPIKYKNHHDQLLSDLETRNRDKNPAISMLAKEISLHLTVKKLILDAKLTNIDEIKRNGKDGKPWEPKLVKMSKRLEQAFSKGTYDVISHSRMIESMISKFTNLTVMKQRETGRMKSFVDGCILVIKKYLPKTPEFQIRLKKINEGLEEEIRKVLS